MTLVVKVGGAAGNRLGPVLDDLAPRRDYVVVHGGSEEVDRLGEKLGHPAEYYTSPSGVTSRKSTPAHLETVVLALAGKVQTTIVREFAARGVRAVGLSGVDGGLLLARRKEGARAVVDGKILRVTDDWSGSIERADPALLRTLLGAGFVPVVGPPAVTANAEIVNVDADRAAAAGYTTAARSSQALGSPVTGGLVAAGGAWIAAPFVVAGVIKAGYDLALYARCRHRPAIEVGEPASRR